MKITKSLITSDKYSLKCPYPMKAKGICIHNTANDAQARNEVDYMKSNNDSTSFHIAIDNVEAVQGLPLDRNAWASGDGANGDGNRNYIHIEICFSKSGGDRFFQAERNTAKVVAKLLKENNWTVENVKKHQDFAKKYCPHRTLDYGWDRFLKMIDFELIKLNEVYDMDKVVLYSGDIDSLSAIIVSQKHCCGVYRKSDFEKLGLKAKTIIQIGGNPGEPTRFDSFKGASKLV